jgi:7-cyano-7-deazaguanine synthase in queuosine biosynthesis
MELLFPKNNFLESNNTYGIWLSGGADSSILAFLLIKHILDNKLPYKLQPISVRKYNEDIDNHLQVANWLRKYFNTDILLSVQDNIKDKNLSEYETFFEINKRNIINRTYNYIFSGITSSPRKEDFVEGWEHIAELENIRGEDAQKFLVFSGVVEHNNELYEFGDIRPFYRMNKKAIAKLYKKYHLTNTLFPITFSCVEPVNNDHCGKCWFCNERKWAFGRI